jgi:hypothetical protein
MLFELHNDATQRISHCGVLEFVAEEGMIIMPYWVCIKELSSLVSSVYGERNTSRLIYFMYSHLFR